MYHQPDYSCYFGILNKMILKYSGSMPLIGLLFESLDSHHYKQYSVFNLPSNSFHVDKGTASNRLLAHLYRVGFGHDDDNPVSSLFTLTTTPALLTTFSGLPPTSSIFDRLLLDDRGISCSSRLDHSRSHGRRSDF